MERIKCSVCGKKFSSSEIFAFYKEDDSFICKNCFGNRKNSTNKRKNKVQVSDVCSKQ